MGHFEIEGAIMQPGMTCPHGLDHTYLKRFDKVLSGHFHHKSEVKNIRYLGSQMQFTWSDYGDQKYFHIFDTQDQSITPVHNPLTMFEKTFMMILKKLLNLLQMQTIVSMQENSQRL